MKYRISTSNERVWCTTHLAKLSFNHSIGRTHSWHFSIFKNGLDLVYIGICRVYVRLDWVIFGLRHCFVFRRTYLMADTVQQFVPSAVPATFFALLFIRAKRVSNWYLVHPPKKIRPCVCSTNLGFSVEKYCLGVSVRYQRAPGTSGKKKSLVPASASLPTAGSALPPVGRATPLLWWSPPRTSDVNTKQ